MLCFANYSLLFPQDRSRGFSLECYFENRQFERGSVELLLFTIYSEIPFMSTLI